MTNLKDLQNEIHQIAQDHGFWKASEDIPTKLMLIVTEIVEAMEEYRDGHMDGVYHKKFADDDGVPRLHAKPEGFGIELADAAIRIFDLAAFLGIDLGEMIDLKVAYNRTRPHLHGKVV